MKINGGEVTGFTPALFRPDSSQVGYVYHRQVRDDWRKDFFHRKIRLKLLPALLLHYFPFSFSTKGKGHSLSVCWKSVITDL